MKDVSIIVPVFNEEENIALLVERIRSVMTETGKSYECLFVDDGSVDRSAEILEDLCKSSPELKLIKFRRNFGQTAALSAGFDRADGDIVITIDADLQNDPQDIPLLIQKIHEGYDLVSGWRKVRQDTLLRRIPSYLANLLISVVTGVKLHDYGCTLKAYKREVAKNLRLYGDMHRFIPALASWSGVSLLEVPVRHHPRLKGKSKYGISRTLRVLLDLFTVKFLLSYSTSPIQIFGGFGLLSAFGGLVFFAVAIMLKLTQARTLTGNPFFYLFIFLEGLCIQLILIGFLAEMNVRTYHEVQKKKTYAVID